MWWWLELEVGGDLNSNVIVFPNNKIILFNSLTFSLCVFCVWSWLWFRLGLSYSMVLFVIRVCLGSKWVMFSFIWA